MPSTDLGRAWLTGIIYGPASSLTGFIRSGFWGPEVFWIDIFTANSEAHWYPVHNSLATVLGPLAHPLSYLLQIPVASTYSRGQTNSSKGAGSTGGRSFWCRTWLPKLLPHPRSWLQEPMHHGILGNWFLPLHLINDGPSFLTQGPGSWAHVRPVISWGDSCYYCL